MTDVMYNPEVIRKAGTILASHFSENPVDYVVTVQTGEFFGLDCKNLGVQLVVCKG